MVKRSSSENKKPNKAKSAFLGVLSLVVIIASISFGNHYPIPATILGLVYFAVALSLTINNHNIAKSKKEDTKKLTSEIVVYSLVTVLTMVLLIFTRLIDKLNVKTSKVNSPTTKSKNITKGDSSPISNTLITKLTYVPIDQR